MIATGPVKRTRVLIAGAGPVGATGAYRLAEMGIDTVLLEGEARAPADMRASTFHPPTLEMMEALGLLDALVADGLKAPVYQYRNRRTDHVIALDMGEIADATRHPFRLQCEQYKLSRLVAAKLVDHPHGAVAFNSRVLHYEQDGDGVTVHVETPLAIETWRADYLIGADGANSTIRKWMGVGFDGFTYPERFLTLSTAYPIDEAFENLAAVNYVADAEEWCVLLRVPGLWRVLVPAHERESDDHLLSDAKKAEILGGLVPGGEGIETRHRTLYRVHQRVAETFRQGRVILAGDAAHLNNPLGGFGMNSGIHDIWNLAGRLRDIILDGADADPLLDHYVRQRRTVAHEFVQAQTIQNKQAMETDVAQGRTLQEERLEVLLTDPAKRHEHLLRQAMIRSLEREAEIA